MSRADGRKLRVGIYRSSSIGDVVLATACLDLCERLGDALEVTWIGRPPSLELLAASWPHVRVLEVPRHQGLRGLFAFSSQLSEFDLVVDLQTNLRSRLACALAAMRSGVRVATCPKAQWYRSRLIVAARCRGRSAPLPDDARKPLKPQYRMMADTLVAALAPYLPGAAREQARTAFPEPRLPLAATPTGAAPQLGLDGGVWLAVAPGAAHPTKTAPLETFLASLRLLRSRLNGLEVGLVFVGDPQDARVADELRGRLDWPWRVVSLAGKVRLFETAAALRRARVLLSNDSALGHIAEAVGTPSAVLFGPTIEGFGFAPRLAASRAFSIDLGCRPCSKHGRTLCRYNDKLCFQRLPLEDIADYLAGRLAVDEA